MHNDPQMSNKKNKLTKTNINNTNNSNMFNNDGGFNTETQRPLLVLYRTLCVCVSDFLSDFLSVCLTSCLSV